MRDLHTPDKYRDRDCIERDALLRKIKRYGLSNGSVLGKHSGAAEELILEVESFPSADVALVRRGHWVRVGNGTTCSECMRGLLRVDGKKSEWVDLSGVPYCPNCGAKMDKEEESCKINPPSI